MGVECYDVIVIGAGSVGAPAALALAKTGVRTLVLDRLPSVGQGSNKHAIGGIRATHSDPAKIRLCLESIRILSTWDECYGDDIAWHRGGYSFVAYDEREEKTLKDLLQIQRAYGLDIQWLDRDALLGVIPDLWPRGLVGGTFAPGDGSASPLLAVHAVFRHAIRLGAEFHFAERVTEILLQRGRVYGVRTDKAEYHTDVVINAAGPWARSIARVAGLDVPVHPDAHEAGVTEPVARFLEPMVVDLHTGAGCSSVYFYQHKTGQILFCATPDPRVWSETTQATSQFLPTASRRMIRIMPRLRGIRVRRTWRGLYPMTPDGLPIVGWAREAGGLLLAVGMCGQGFMLGPGLGELLARLVTGRTTKTDREIVTRLSPDRAFAGQERLE
jgi:sarcosine oxidase subunit beta